MTKLEASEKTPVLILGSSHLRLPEQVPMLESLLERLRRFQPQHIAIEAMPAKSLQLMQARDPEYAETLKIYGEHRIKAAEEAQRQLGLSVFQAEQTIRQEQPQGARLILLLLAAYDLYSAALQWAYLHHRPDHGVPEKLAADLDGVLESPSELSSIGLRLAHDLGLQRLEYMDDHTSYGAEFHQADQELDRELEAMNYYEQYIKQQPLMLRWPKIYKKAAAKRDLLPFFLHMNTPHYSREVEELESGSYLRLRLASKVDRTKLGLWELRNMNMAAHIRRITGLYPSERLLVVVGASHKPYLERYLKQLADIRLVQLRELE